MKKNNDKINSKILEEIVNIEKLELLKSSRLDLTSIYSN